MGTGNSKRLHKRARRVIPGGVNSPVRAFGSVGGVPRFITSASGACLGDVDGNRYVDYVASWGAIIVGHAHPMVVDAIRTAAGRGSTYGAPTEAEIELAEKMVEWVPSLDVVRLVSSGTEAVMSALRLARAATGREKLIKFEGCYHGHSNELLAAAGSGVATLGMPGTAGVTQGAVGDTLIAPFNDAAAVRRIFDEHRSSIAAVVVEPIPANMGMVLPQPGFLEALREQGDAAGSLLVFDEVISGFRVGREGAQGRFGVKPDLSTYGKVVGGGLPVGAYGGREDLMRQIAPDGEVFQAGTLSGNPIAVAAGLATLELLSADRVYTKLEEVGQQLVSGLAECAEEFEIAVWADALGGVLGYLFLGGPAQNYSEVCKADERRYAGFFHALLDAGGYTAPSAFEVGFLTTAHGPDEVSQPLEAARRALRTVS